MKRVCILSRHALFREGIEALLMQQDEIEIVCWEASLSAGSAAALELIQRAHPDVVVVDYDDPELDLAPAVIGMLKRQLGVCVIGLSLRDNRLTICRGEHKDVLEVEDLITAINE